ncbi:Beta-galactosidase [subsurface metagenome]
MRIPSRLIAITLSILFYGNLSIGQPSPSIEKQIKYLSGTDNINTITWDFFCTGGRKSGMWTKIEVPSCWEQQGFGLYNYGRDYHTYGKVFKYADEKGIYRFEFIVPKNWKDKKIDIIFEGSMTDTEVTINGKSAGEKHQGSFYRFRYDISDKLNFGQNNVLEVTVSKMSSNKSVNAAERYADYWIFGGIFRPVYLEAYPKEHIERIALVVPANGAFSADIFPKNLKSGRNVKAEILDPSGNLIAGQSMKTESADSMIRLKIQVDKPLLWTAETPNLYKVNVYLLDDKKILYKTSEKFGFRTIEIKKGDGIYINDTKVKMKGINRHAFWPETGRCLSPQINLMDVLLIKEMNMNAVRCSHYPPDKEFLDYCDSLGLYVIDELAGWHNAYDTVVGEKLVREMVIRDVNHPSILFWSNGNEGGHNKDLIDDYAIYDPSIRPVIHAHHRPGNAINGIECNHYPSYRGMQNTLKDPLIYMTTEFLHCQNDGGGGAGLNDYWNLMLTSEKSGGGFLWALLDEGIVRTDRNNIIDVNGVNAPDGVLGPHREKEGSFYAIREIFTPIYIPVVTIDVSVIDTIPIENRFEFTNLSACQFKWKLVDFHSLFDYSPGYSVEVEGIFNGSNIKPGEKGNLRIPLPENFLDYDALVLEAYDPYRNQVMNWSWKIESNKEIVKQFRSEAVLCPSMVEETNTTLSITVNKITIVLSKLDGSLLQIKNHRNRFQNFSFYISARFQIFW